LREAAERETSTESGVLDGLWGVRGRATQLEVGRQGDAPGVSPAGSRTLLVFPRPFLPSWCDNNMGGLLGTHRSAPTILLLRLVVIWENDRDVQNQKGGNKKRTYTKFPTGGSQLTWPVEGQAKKETPVFFYTSDSAPKSSFQKARKERTCGSTKVTQKFDPHAVSSGSFTLPFVLGNDLEAVEAGEPGAASPLTFN
jgi:hypothetical protein